MEKVVLITGVFGGIGYATAEYFNKKGWIVVGIDRVDRDDDKKIINHYFNKDISNANDILEIIDFIKIKYGKLDCLVNNAAVQICKSIDDITEEDWDEVFSSNVKAIFFTVKYAHKLLKEAEGAIVNVSSVHAFATSRDISAYASSKGAILAFTRSIALEFSMDKIRVNAVLPGAVDTGMLRAGLSRGLLEGDDIEQRIENLGLKHPSKKIGKPEEIAKAIYFLGDNSQASFITGQSLIVDGGALAQLSTES